MTKISDLSPAPFNPRDISEEALKSLARSMIEFGDLSGIVVNVRSGNMVSGHQRIKGLGSDLSIETEPASDSVGTVAIGYVLSPFGRWQYREVDWPEQKEVAACIAANKHSGEWDYPKLKDLLCDLDDGEFDLSLTGFDEKALKGLIDFEPEKVEPEEKKGGTSVCPHCGLEI